MRPTKTLALLAGRLWMLDFRSGRALEIPARMHLLAESLEPIFSPWDEDMCWRLWHDRLRYINYAEEEDVQAQDASDNAERHRTERQPSLQLEELLNAGHCTPLPEPGHGEGLWAVASTILNLSLRRQEVRRFHGDTIQIKPSPSVGARHGVEAFLSFEGKVFYYDCAGHALVDIGLEADDGPVGQEISIHLCMRAEVYMWRYQSGNCLVDVYLDVGHVIANMAIAATLLGLKRPRLMPHSYSFHKSIMSLAPITSFWLCMS